MADIYVVVALAVQVYSNLCLSLVVDTHTLSNDGKFLSVNTCNCRNYIRELFPTGRRNVHSYVFSCYILIKKFFYNRYNFIFKSSFSEESSNVLKLDESRTGSYTIGSEFGLDDHTGSLTLVEQRVACSVRTDVLRLIHAECRCSGDGSEEVEIFGALCNSHLLIVELAVTPIAAGICTCRVEPGCRIGFKELGNILTPYILDGECSIASQVHCPTDDLSLTVLVLTVGYCKFSLTTCSSIGKANLGSYTLNGKTGSTCILTKLLKFSLSILNIVGVNHREDSRITCDILRCVGHHHIALRITEVAIESLILSPLLECLTCCRNPVAGVVEHNHTIECPVLVA